MVRRDVEAEQRREGRVLLVPVEGPGLLAVALVPVPGLAVRLRRRRRRAATRHTARRRRHRTRIWAGLRPGMAPAVSGARA